MARSLPPLAELLAKHGLLGVPESPFEHNGYSGAVLTRLVRDDGAVFVIKRASLKRDWIMRWTNDASCREAQFAAAGIDLGDHVRSPALGGAVDGDGFAVLMTDISDQLVPAGAISSEQLDTIIGGLTAVHRAPLSEAGIDWCDVGLRLSLLTPAAAEIAAACGAPVAGDLRAGWALFEKHASPEAVAIVHGLFSDLRPLLAALDRLPNVFLHSDPKLDNVGIDEDGCVLLIDWAMTLRAPAAGELGWFLAINSRRLPVSLDEVMRRYTEAAESQQKDRELHYAATVLCGLLLRGWRKALDAEEGEPDELRWWCERASEARWVLR